MTTYAQRSFAGGEISPALYGRVDTIKYATGLRSCRNFFVMRHGGIATRPGTTFVGEVSDSSVTVRLIPFAFNLEQTYVLEFGNQYMRVIQDGVFLTETTKAITAITQASPTVMTVTSHGYSNGDEVYVSGVSGMTEVNGRNFKVANVSTHTFELQEMDGTNLDSTAYTAYTSGGTAAKIYEIATPYVTADIAAIKFVQSADVVTLTHPTYAQRKLSRTGHTTWTITTYTFAPDISRPIGGSGSAGGAGSDTYRYRVTAIASETFEESLPGREATQTISGATQANPCVVTITGHTLNDGDEIYIDSIVGMTELNEGTYLVANKATNTIELTDLDGTNIDSTAYTAYSSAGTSARTFINIGSAAVPSTSAPHSMSWTSVTSATEYNIYRELNGIYGFVGISGSTSFDDVGTTPDVTDTPPSARNPFNASDDYPETCTYAQQRLVFANTNNNTQTVWMSRTGQFNNFTISSPLQDDDAVTFTMSGRQVNEIRHLLDLGGLIVLTSGGEWAVQGNASGIITPTDINMKQYSYNGVSDIIPIIIGSNAIYVQDGDSIVRDLGYDYQVDGYRGTDLTIFSSHLTDGYTIVDWAYQKLPHSIVWAVRNDGTLLGLTYVRDQEMIAWHRHDFDGTVENVVSVREGDEYAVYLTIKRTINSKTVRYIERMTQRRIAPQVDDIVDFKGADSCLSYDGRNTNTSHTMTLSGGTNWTYDETLTLTSSTAYFTSSEVGNAIHLTGSDGTIIRFIIEAYTSTTVVTGKASKTVPSVMQSTAMSTWTRSVDQVTGLWHLEGKQVSVLGDGFVVANPNNDSYDTATVASGSITLDKPYGGLHIGLPITCDAETLDIDTWQGETLVDKKKRINKVTMLVESSRGVWAGSKSPTSDSSLTGLSELKIRNAEDYDSPVALQTGPIDLTIGPEWSDGGRVFIRQTDPLPLTVLSISPSGLMPFS